MPDLSQLAALMVLLCFAYLGGGLMHGRGHRLWSIVAFVGAGVVLGPWVADVLDARSLASLDGLAQVAYGWLALLVGLRLFTGVGLGGARPFLLAMFPALVGLGATAWAVEGVLVVANGCNDGACLPLAVGIASVTLATSVRSVAKSPHLLPTDPTRELVAGKVNELVALVATAAVFAHGVASPARLPPLPWTVATCGLGAIAGLAAAAIVGDDTSESRWSLSIGVALLTVGISVQANLSPLTTMFVLGVILARMSGAREHLRHRLSRTESAVLLPLLVVAGARLELEHIGRPLGLLLVAVVGRVFTWFLRRMLTRRAFVGATATTSAVNESSKSQIAVVPVMIGVAFSIRFPGTIGSTILLISVALPLIAEAATLLMPRQGHRGDGRES